MKKLFIYLLQLIIIVDSLYPAIVYADTPVSPYFELCVSPSNGGDCSGDGNGTLNKFFVGQTFNARIMISTGGSNTKSANVIVNYDTTHLSVNDAKPAVPGTQIQAGILYESYPDSGNTVNDGTIKLTGANTSGGDYNGTGIFGTISFTVISQKIDPLSTIISFTPGSTVDSNIVRSGDSQDILNFVENSSWELLPDTNKPYLDTLNYPDSSSNVPVESNLTFRLKDDETGINTATINIFIQENGGETVNRNSWVTASCSGLWNSNNCLITINPADIGNRNWDYGKEYTITVRDTEDRASVSQTPAGPNVMDQYVFSFETESDKDTPTVTNALPVGNSEPVETNISFRIADIKTSSPILGSSGTGIDPFSILVDITSASGLFTYNCSDDHTICQPLENNNLIWAYDITIDPQENFAQSELVLISIRNSQDYSTPPNIMDSYNWSFRTEDTIGPVVDRWDPPKGANNLSELEKISFHISDGGVGVDIATLSVVIGETSYTLLGENNFSYSGDASDYLVEITPITAFLPDSPQAISINVSDNSGNSLDPQDLYAVVNDIDPIIPGCPICATCDQPQSNHNPSNSQGATESTSEKEAVDTSGGNVQNITEKSCQDIPTMREVLSKIDTTFKSQIEEFTLISEINNRKLKKPERQFILFGGKQIKISGTTIPHATVSLVAYSQPIIKETTSDSRGNWNITLENNFKTSAHTVFLDIEKDAMKSGYIYGAKILLVPLWIKISSILLIIFLILLIIKIYLWKKEKR